MSRGRAGPVACVADRFDDCMCPACEPEIRQLFGAAWRLAKEQDEIDATHVPLGDLIDQLLITISDPL